MKVLSLFDGMSGAYQALKNLGVKVDKYYASEIDKWAIKVAKKNHPEIIHIGDVKEIKTYMLPEKIDLLIGGSPCQGFSFAGKQLNFEDERSVLFFEFVRILKEVKPKYFLLENVRMKKEYQDVISNLLGVEPVMIDSQLLTAQMRKRLYWTNIEGIEQPSNKGIFLKDIIIDAETDREKSFCLDANYFKGASYESYIKKSRRQLVLAGHATNIKGHDSIKRIYDISGKCPTLTTMGGGHREPKISVSAVRWRKLTPIECERLQGYSDNYTVGVSNTQRYKMLGNSFTVPVISHILKRLA